MKKADGAKQTFSSTNEIFEGKAVISEDEPSDAVSSEVALFSGCVAEMNGETIKVASKRNFDKLEIGSKTYRLDVIDYDDPPSLHYWNLGTLMSRNTPWKGKDFRKLRDYIINASERNLDDSNLHPSMGKKRQCNFLNQIKNHRLFHGIFHSDEAIIKIVTVLRKAGKSILIVSHDSTILCRVLLMLKNLKLDFVYFSMQVGDGTGIEEYTIERKIERIRSDNQTINLKKIYQKITIAAATCSTLPYKSSLFQRSFDISIILEADRISLPAILRPLFISERAILIGDETSAAVGSGKSMGDVACESLFNSQRRKSEVNKPRIEGMSK